MSGRRATTRGGGATWPGAPPGAARALTPRGARSAADSDDADALASALPAPVGSIVSSREAP